MKRLFIKTIIMCICLLSHLTKGQSINKAEYFVDTDPGYGLAINIPVTPASQLANVSFTANLGTVSTGFHSLYMRIRDVNGKWSQTYNRPFYKETLPATLTNITKAEYFIDTDPGFGNGIKIEITPGTSLSGVTYIVNLSSVSNGFHSLYMRVKDANGNWSQVYSRPFYKENIPSELVKITRAEYYIDSDPGYGSGTEVSIVASSAISDHQFSVNLSSVSLGGHNLYFRVKDANGNWSLTQIVSFTKSIATGIESVEEIQWVDVYPNPSASGIFTINFGQNLPDKIEVISTGSKLVYSGAKVNELDLSSLQSGVYFLKVNIGERTVYKKIIKE